MIVKKEDENVQLVDFTKKLEPGMIELDTLDGFPGFDKNTNDFINKSDDSNQKDTSMDDTIEIEAIKDETE